MVGSNSRRQVKLLTLVITVVVVSLLQYILLNSHTGTYVASTAVDKANEYVFSRRRKLRVAIVNTQLSHDEVLVPLVESWLKVPQTDVTIFQVGFRFGMDKVLLDSGHPPSMTEYIYAGEFKKIGKDPRYALPDIVVSTTCVKDTFHMNETWYYLLENYHTHFFCVFHHAEQMDNGRQPNLKVIDRLGPFVRAGRIDFVALSHHVADFARNDQFGRKWNVVKDELHHPPVHVFPPVFRFQSTIEPSESPEGAGRAGGFALQGEYEKGRDYRAVFKHLIKFVRESAAGQRSPDSINVHLLGFGERPRVPGGLEKHVIFDERLEYTEFYNTLREVDAVLTAFAEEDYYLIKASSTVPAALIAGTPLVGDKRLLQSYRYLDESIVWLQKPGESEMEAVGRVLKMGQEEKDAKKAAVQGWTEKLIEQNHVNVRQWTEQAVAKFPENWSSR